MPDFAPNRARAHARARARLRAKRQMHFLVQYGNCKIVLSAHPSHCVVNSFTMMVAHVHSHLLSFVVCVCVCARDVVLRMVCVCGQCAQTHEYQGNWLLIGLCGVIYLWFIVFENISI